MFISSCIAIFNDFIASIFFRWLIWNTLTKLSTVLTKYISLPRNSMNVNNIKELLLPFFLFLIFHIIIAGTKKNKMTHHFAFSIRFCYLVFIRANAFLCFTKNRRLDASSSYRRHIRDAISPIDENASSISEMEEMFNR